jgi:hypothetical protein
MKRENWGIIRSLWLRLKSKLPIADVRFVGVPSVRELKSARKQFRDDVKDDRYYWSTLDEIERATPNGSVTEIATSLAAFLKVWNRQYYRFHPDKIPTLPGELKILAEDHWALIHNLRSRSLVTFSHDDHADVVKLFERFADKLDPVGAAKALHPLAPNFFPLWDNAVASGYGICVGSPGYCLFMVATKQQVESLAGSLPDDLLTPSGSALKILDEYNYCKYTRGWNLAQ